jgi:hypothetical protein
MKRMKDVAIFSQMFYPNPSATGKLITDIAIGLSKKFVVDVYTQNLSYMDPKVRFYDSLDKKNSY